MASPASSPVPLPVTQRIDSPTAGERAAGIAAPVALAAGFLAEFLLFDQVGGRRHTWIYPRWNDQIQYLSESYTAYERLRAHGFWPALGGTLVNASAQGTLHDFFALLVFSVAGPSRSAALSLNLLALIAWQAALFLAVVRGTRSRGLACAAALLPLALAWPWNGWAGSTADFRLDHLAMCAFGVTLAAALRTDGFRARGASAVFGVAVGLTMLTRFITGAYFAGIFLVLLVWLRGRTDRRRLANLALAGLVAAVVAGPVFWINRRWIWSYYAIGHFTGPESAIRNPHLGLGASLAFVWGFFVRSHLGAFFGWLTGAGTVLLGAARFARPAPPGPARTSEWWLLGATFLLVPALILTLHPQKSEIVLGVLAPGAIVLVLAAWAGLLGRGRRAAQALAALVAVATGLYFTVQQFRPVYTDAFAADAREVNILADYLFKASRAARLENPTIGVDQVTDCLDAQIMRVICYERQKVWEPFLMTLPTGIWKEEESVLFDRLAQSDFVFLTEGGPAGVWPYDGQMRALLPRTSAWCEGHLRLVGRFTLFGKNMALYQRREIPFADPFRP